MGAVITVQSPYRKEDIPMDIVAVKTKRHSWMVDLKHAGRSPRLDGGETSDGSIDDLMSGCLKSVAITSPSLFFSIFSDLLLSLSEKYQYTE